MKAKNEMKLTLEGRSVNESFARLAVAAFVMSEDPTVEEMIDLKTAVSEAVTNCIVHAYPDRIGKIYITAKLFPERTVEVKIRDRGCGIRDVRQAMEPMFTTDQSGERSGLGFAVMESLCNKLRVRSKEGKGTVVTLVKQFCEKPVAHD